MTTLSIGLAVLLSIALVLLLLPLTQKQTANKDKTTQKSVVVIALFIPLFSIAMYFILGTPQFAEMATKKPPAPMQTLVDKLQAKLNQKPNNFDGWLLLGRSYEVTKEHSKAVYAFEKALSLQPNSLEAILPLADAIAIQQSGSLLGRPYELLMLAYSIAPENPMTLWLLGMAEKQKNNLPLAERYWQTLYQQLADGTEDKKAVSKLLASIGVLVNTDMDKKAIQPSLSVNQTEQDTAVQKSKDGIQISFEIDNISKQKIADATIFIYLKQPQGMPMPIAAQRYQGKNLPNSVIISSADELMPNRSLKQFNYMLLGVKITLGDATSQTILYQKRCRFNLLTDPL